MKRIFSIVLATVLVGIGIVLLTNKGSAPSDSQNINTQTTGSSSEPAKTFTASQVAQHSSANDCWMIINTKVYDVTKFVALHPGGKEIVRGCGKDATTLFEQRRTDSGQEVGSGTPHSSNAASTLQEYYIGDLAQ